MNESLDFGAATLLGDKAMFLDASEPLESAITVHGDLARFAPFANVPELQCATTLLAAWDGASRTARAWSPGTSTPFQIFATREQIGTLYDAGFTILLEDVERIVPELRPLCRSLERDLGVAAGKVNVQAFFSRRGGHGRPHFDPGFNFNCQLRGEKVWRIRRNDALRFPPVGMFLGRPPGPENEPLLEGPLPTDLEGAETFLARPGSVVFLPPGVLHETLAEGETLAIGFAVEHVDTVASRVLDRVKRSLLQQPELRAGRLRGQRRSLAPQRALAAAALRKLADELETDEDALSDARKCLVRMRPGLSAMAESTTQVRLEGPTTSRQLTLDPSLVTVLDWASRRTKPFDATELANELPRIPFELSRSCIRQLLHTQLFEPIELRSNDPEGESA